MPAPALFVTAPPALHRAMDGLRFDRRSFLIGLLLMMLVPSSSAPGAQDAPARGQRIPVILDTDIGDDIDDTWALGLLLKCPELDLKLVVGDYGRPDYRARLLAKFLQTAGRADVPVGLGIEVPNVGGEAAQAEWVKDYDLKSYPGRVHADGVQAMIDTILASREPVTLIAIGPLPNVAAALEREPKIAQRARFVGMHGSVRVGYGGSTNVAAEWNVKAAPLACRQVFTAPWDVTITPLDTCGLVILEGERYRRLTAATDPVPRAILENYRLWAAHRKQEGNPAKSRSSTLFDTVAVYLAVSHDLCRMESVGLRVTNEGFTLIDPQAKPVRAATAWNTLDAFRDWLVQQLLAETVAR